MRSPSWRTSADPTRPGSTPLRLRWRAGLLVLLTGLACAHPDLLEQIELLDAQLARNPGDAGLLVQRGDLHRRHENYEAALRDFSAARAIRPDNPEQDLAEGRLRLETADPASADALFSRYLEAHPEHAAAWNLRGQARLALRRPLDAAADFLRSIELSPAATPVLYRQHAAALVAAGQAHWQAALGSINAGLLHHPQDVSLLGLGTDIALAQRAVDHAGAFIERLPAEVAALPQWRARTELAECIAAGGSAADRCAQLAWSRLWAKV